MRNSWLGERIRTSLRLDRAVGFVWRAGPGWALAGLVFMVLQGLLPLLTVYLTKLIVDGVAEALTASAPMEAYRDVALYIGLAGGAALLNAVSTSMAGLVQEAQTVQVTDHMYGVLHAKSVEADLAYYENPSYFDTLHRAQREAPYRPTRILNGLMRLGQSGVLLVAMAGLLLSFHWAVTVILFCAAGPGVLLRLKNSRRLYRWARRQTEEERKANYLNWILTGDLYAKELRLFGLGGLFQSRFREIRKRLRDERIALSRKRYFGELAAQTMAVVAVFGCFLFIAYRTVQGMITLGDMVMYYQAFQRGMNALRGVLRGLADLYEDNLFLYNLLEFLSLEPRVREPAHPVPIPRPMRQGFVFEQVGFVYPGTKKRVLESVSLSIRPGEVAALVGRNGSGKTTLVKLLCRLYDPVEGRILLDGSDLRQFKTADLRREISVVFQDYVRFYMTARENIRFGNVSLPSEDPRIAEAAQDAGVDDLIRALPAGYDTILGRRFEDGVELSVGEWQKIALARAFVRDAQIVVLDEPTSSMDAMSELEVFEGFKSLLKGRAAVLISHRFSTVKMADTIYVLDQGRIVEAGAHADLIKEGGMYAELFESQARRYR